MFTEVLSALARRSLVAERLIARALAPTRPTPAPVAVTALTRAAHKGADLVIRGTDGAYAVTHSATLVGAAVVVLATVVDGRGDRVGRRSDVIASLPGVVRAAPVVGRWSLMYPVTAAPIHVDPVAGFSFRTR
jgi:hypothetical protein